MRILVATDQPYWLRTGGAQQRIDSLLRGLKRIAADHAEKNTAEKNTAVEIATFFLGEPVDLPKSFATTGSIFCPRSNSSSLSVWAHIRAGLFERRLSMNSKSQLNSERQPTEAKRVESVTTLTLQDYRWKWVFPHFRKAVAEFQPDVILLEYITMAYLREAVADPALVWALDTHDRLAQRYHQFREAGQSHWLAVDDEEERTAWDVADLLIAIQDEEAQWMRDALPGKPVVVAGHSAKLVSRPARVASPASAAIRCGFLASNNFPNQQGLEFLLNQVWPRLQAHWRERTPILVVAGSLGIHAKAWMEDREELRRSVQIIGFVEDLNDFYSQVEIVLNPVTLGTGLKIKTSEAISFAKPMIASRHAAGGFADHACGIVLAETVEEWLAAFQRFIVDENDRIRLATAAWEYAEKSLQCKVVYEPLFQRLLQMVNAKRE